MPSGRAVRLDYQDGGTVVAGVKLQELFGLADTPRIGPRQTPVVLELRAPNGRAVQLTTRSAQLLGAHVPGGAPRAARPLPAPPVA